MILAITNKLDTTADLLIVQAAHRGVKIVRVNTEDLPQTEWEIDPLVPLVRFRCAAGEVSSESIRGIWYRRPLAPTYPPDIALSPSELRFLAEQWRGLLDALEALPGVRWLSRPSSIQQAENKVLQLRWAVNAGFAVPASRITNSVRAFSAFRASEGVVIAKALAGGYVKGEPARFIFTSLVPMETVPKDDEFAASPILLQRRLRPDAHLRITVVGEKSLAAEVVPTEGYDLLDWRTSEAPPTVRSKDVPNAVATAAVNLVRTAGLSFSSMDVLRVGDEYFFLDLNPNGEWGWLERGAGLPISDAILDFLVGEG